MKTLKTLKQEMLADADTRAAYNTMADEFAIARELIAARARAGLSQGEVAQRMGTTQSVVARLESGKRPPSMRTVERFAQAVGGHLVFRIEQPVTA
jgi:predicted transcriptional regulator